MEVGLEYNFLPFSLRSHFFILEGFPGETKSPLKECICTAQTTQMVLFAPDVLMSVNFCFQRYMILSFKVIVQIRMKMLAMMILKISWLRGGKTTLDVVLVGVKKGSEKEQRH